MTVAVGPAAPELPGDGRLVDGAAMVVVRR